MMSFETSCRFKEHKMAGGQECEQVAGKWPKEEIIKISPKTWAASVLTAVWGPKREARPH